MKEKKEFKSLIDFFEEEGTVPINNDITASFMTGLEKWIMEVYTPEIENWFIDEFAPKIQEWILEEYQPEFEKWIKQNFMKKWFIKKQKDNK